MSKIIACRCEDVTVHELQSAFDRGHQSLEQLKRYTGLGTGWCQGKQCLANCARWAEKQHDQLSAPAASSTTAAGTPAPLQPFTSRPLLRPVKLKTLTQLTEARQLDAPPPSVFTPIIQKDAATTQADWVIIGGGIMGLSIALHLAKLGEKNIVVLESHYLTRGASGRNGGGVRAQWSSSRNIELMKASLAHCARFSSEMGINVWFRKGGYLFVARDSGRAAQLAASIELQRDHGLNTRWLDPSEVKVLVPDLNVSKVIGASYNPDDGVVFPWPFLWGYAEAAKKLGVRIVTESKVIGLEVRGQAVTQVITPKARYQTSKVVVAAGAESPDVFRLCGVTLPSHPHRHEIASTESLKPFLDPLVGDLESGLYFSQSMRGEIVGGLSDKLAPNSLDWNSSSRFLSRYSRALTELMPRLGPVKILRQWAGSYDVTEDGNPLCGEIDEVTGLFAMSGFMGHGFMMAPVMGERFAEHCVGGRHKELFETWNPRRFRLGKTLSESMILG